MDKTDQTIQKGLEMSYARIFKDRREKAGLTQKEVAKQTGYSIMTISYAERPYEDTKQMPSEAYIEKFTKIFGESENDRRELLHNLMLSRAIYLLPEEVRHDFVAALNATQGIVRSGAMPVSFRKMVSKDLEVTKKRSIKGFTNDHLNQIVSGTRLMTKDEVVQLAGALKKDPDTYTITAGYLPDSLHQLINRMTITSEQITLMTELPNATFHKLEKILKFLIETFAQDSLGSSKGKKK